MLLLLLAVDCGCGCGVLAADSQHTAACLSAFVSLLTLRYATIKEEEGRCYLYMKTVERAHTPKHMWQKIKLKRNYAQVRACVCWRLQGVLEGKMSSSGCRRLG
jgi:hypothetical protein